MLGERRVGLIRVYWLIVCSNNNVGMSVRKRERESLALLRVDVGSTGGSGNCLMTQ